MMNPFWSGCREHKPSGSAKKEKKKKLEKKKPTPKAKSPNGPRIACAAYGNGLAHLSLTLQR